MAETKAAPKKLDPATLAPVSRASEIAKSIRLKMKDSESIVMMTDTPPKASSISTGSLALDDAIGIGGFPQGRVVEILGFESSGKSTIALQTVASCQAAGGVATYVDAEHAVDMRYAEALGVKGTELLLCQPMSAEEGLGVALAAVEVGQKGDVVVVDSVAALTPQAEIDGDMGQAHMGLQARLMGQAMRKMAAIANERGVLVVFINQWREKIGVMFGSNKVSSGGNALKYYASVRVEVTRIGSEKEGEVVVANKTKAKVIKNKVAPPFREALFEIRFGVGVDRRSEIIDYAEKFNLVQKSGSHFSYQGNKVANGRGAFTEYLVANPAIEAELLAGVQAAMRK